MMIFPLKVPLTGTSDEIRLGFGKDPAPSLMLPDEVIILKKFSANRKSK
jgi:hypothetical protein